MKREHFLTNTGTYDRYRVSDLDVDFRLRTVTRGTDVLDIHSLSFDMFALLVARAPDVVSRAEFAQHVWRRSHLSEETFVQRAAILRRALGDTAKLPKYIRTVRGEGYAIACEVRAVEKHETASAMPWRRTKQVVLGLGGVAAVFVAGAIALGTGQGIEPEFEKIADTSVSALQLARATDLLALHQPLETDQAIDLLESALSKDPQSLDIRLALSFAYSTRATKFDAKDGDVANAERLAREVISDDVKFGRAWHALAYALDAQGRVDEAISSYQYAFLLNPDDVSAMSSAAYLFQIRGRYSDALDLEARALEISEPTLYAPLQIATTLGLLDHPASRTWWDRALASGSHQSVILTEAMQEDLRRDAPRGALDRLASAPDAVQLTPRALRLSGRAHLKLGELEAARDAFERAGESARFESASLARQLGEESDASALIEAAEAAMIEGDSWPELRVRLAELYSASGDHETALALISRAVDLGWRDQRYIQTSPFFSALIVKDDWQTLRNRIEREVEAQRELVLARQQSPAFELINAPL